MNIKRVELTNIRCFDDIRIDLSSDGGIRKWAVILGDNGVGKTTLLRSIALALGDRESAAALLRDLPGEWVRRESTNKKGIIRVDFSNKAINGQQPVEKGVIDRVSRHGEAYRGEGGFAILRDDEDDLNDQDGSSGRNKHEQGANSARHGLLRGAGADELAHQQR